MDLKNDVMVNLINIFFFFFFFFFFLSIIILALNMQWMYNSKRTNANLVHTHKQTKNE